MENNKNKKSVKFQGDVLNFCDFIQVFVFTRNHHLNTTYKLASACIADRLKKVLPCLIDEDQTGFISGRYIGENIRLLYDVISYLEKNNYPGMLLLIDFEKAFDSVSWEFLFKVIEYFNFGNSFMKWIKVFL